MNVRTTAFAFLLALGALQGAQAQAFDDDPFFYDPAFAAQGISLDGIAGPNNTCLEQTCNSVKVARLSNGDTVTAVQLYSWHDDGVGGGYQDDGDFALIRHDAGGQRLAWANPSPGYAHYNNQYLLWPNNDTSGGRMVSRVVDLKAVDGHVYVLDKRNGLTCMELRSGKKRWDDGNRMTPKGRNPQATMVWAGDGDRALILNAEGDLILAQLNEAGYHEQSRTNIIGATSMEQLKTDIASIDVTITPELEERINAIHVAHCNPCP